MTTLLRLFEELAADPAAKARFVAAPDQFLEGSGFGGLPPEDIAEALAHAADAFPPALAAQVDPDAGLQSLVEVDLLQLGLSGIDDFDSIWEPTAGGEPSPDPPEPTLPAPEDEPDQADGEPALLEDPLALDASLTGSPTTSPTTDPLTADPDALDPGGLDEPDWNQDPSTDELERFQQMDDFEGDVGDELL